MITLYGYPKCGSCRKAKKWFEEKGIGVNDINIAENPPSEEELKELVRQSGLDLKKFFNTSGMKYRELGLKDKLPGMTEEEKIRLLVSDGMLIKRPIATDGARATVGFREDAYEETWSRD